MSANYRLQIIVHLIFFIPIVRKVEKRKKMCPGISLKPPKWVQKWSSNVFAHVGPQGSMILLKERIPLPRLIFWSSVVIIGVFYTLLILNVDYTQVTKEREKIIIVFESTRSGKRCTSRKMSSTQKSSFRRLRSV